LLAAVGKNLSPIEKPFGSATVGDRGGNQRGANAWNLVELLARFVGTVASVDHAVELLSIHS
jgi:hypothetical protein